MTTTSDDLLDTDAKPTKAPQGYQPPHPIRVGDVVLFKRTPEEEKSTPAMVMEVFSGGVIKAQAYQEDNAILGQYDAVYHINDPLLRKRVGDERHVWEHRPQDLELINLKRVVDGLRKLPRNQQDPPPPGGEKK